jgi:hypothetical protein
VVERAVTELMLDRVHLASVVLPAGFRSST